MIDKENLERKTLAACEEDHVGLWEIVRIVERQAPEADAAQRRSIALDLLQNLLSAGKIEAGVPSMDGQRFEAWTVPVPAIMAMLKKEWTPDRRPTIGEIVWFTTPHQVRQRV
jgi:hypothetical protein